MSLMHCRECPSKSICTAETIIINVSIDIPELEETTSATRPMISPVDLHNAQRNGHTKKAKLFFNLKAAIESRK